MLPKEKRVVPYPSQEFIGHLQGERGKKYFPHCSCAKERYSECIEAILDPLKGVIVSDGREIKTSTHQCLFINKNNENIALPLGITDDGKIAIITIKSITENEKNPKWFYDNYNEIAKTRNMTQMERVWRPINANN